MRTAAICWNSIKGRDCKLELQAELLNICGDNNTALKEACRTLKEYAVFTEKMRKYVKTMSVEEAAEITIEECIREDILQEFLMRHKAEARAMSIFEYDQEKHLKMEREQAWEEGRLAGIAELVDKKLQKGKTFSQIAEELETDEAVIAGIAAQLSQAAVIHKTGV